MTGTRLHADFTTHRKSCPSLASRFVPIVQALNLARVLALAYAPGNFDAGRPIAFDDFSGRQLGSSASLRRAIPDLCWEHTCFVVCAMCTLASAGEPSD